MIIGDLYVLRLALAPAEANPPLVVDPNAILPCTVPFERLQTVARGNKEVLQRGGAMQVLELPSRRRFHGREPAHRFIFKETLRFPATKRSDQGSVYYALGIPSSGMNCTTQRRPCGDGAACCSDTNSQSHAKPQSRQGRLSFASLRLGVSPGYGVPVWRSILEISTPVATTTTQPITLYQRNAIFRWVK